MKKEMIRRFARPELWLHWSHAVLYLTLFGSGTLLLVGRILDDPLLPHEILASLHRIAGIAMVAILIQMLLLSIVAEPFRCFWRTLGECLRWRWSDVIWLIKVPLNTLTRRVTLPPADRFNAGQKLHVLVVVCALAGFCISGLLMMFVPGAIGPWIVHLVCFLPAAAFLALHLFLSLVNPETRKALPAIFTGHMPLDLARQHHGLWAGQCDSRDHSSYVSLRVMLIMMAVLVVAAAILVACYGPRTVWWVVATTIARQGTNAVSPAPLSNVHAGESSGIQYCAGCHVLTASPPSNKCLVCHTEIGDRMAGASGFHGMFSGSCRQCHPEHRGADATLVSLDRQTFNHGIANFPLDGKHQAVLCEDCHERKADPNAAARMQYIGLDHESCTSCHPDPHGDSRAADCLACHTMQGWRRDCLTFDHGRDSKFPLAGGHVTLDCEKCHPRKTTDGQVQVRLFDVGRSCRDCHADPHRGQFAAACDQCHTEHGWTGRWLASFHGPGSSFPLKGRHADVRCDQCHRVPREGQKLAEAQFTGTPCDCKSCHADPHEGQFQGTCDECHAEQGWTGRWLVKFHAPGSSFPLRGRHADLRCEQCHRVPEGSAKLATAQFAGLGRNCRSCHADPHAGQMSWVCDTCHTETSWTGSGLLFSHAQHTSFPLDTLHSTAACAACHGRQEKRYRPLPHECGSCHTAQQDALRGVSGALSGPPDSHNGRLSCTDCHDVNKTRQSPSEFATRCATCHNPRYGDLFYSWASALDESRAIIRESLKRTESLDDAGRRQRERILEDAAAVGFHNLTLAQEILRTGTPAPAENAP
ncbi:MAG: cytochrome b/b6 domain-containing protein [Phycisphaerales bacterium]